MFVKKFIVSFGDLLFDRHKLKKILCMPIVEISAKKKFGLKRLKYEILKMCLGDYKNNRVINLPNQIEKLYEIGDLIEKLVVKKNFNVKQKNFFYGWDKIILNKFFALPIMFLLLLIIFWITIFGANYFSDWLAILFGELEILLRKLFFWLGINKFLTGLFIDGMYRTLAWIIAVMLPPMAIFFPLFNILEDFGLLPRIAFNCDGIFKKFNCHGKQVLSMCMGFGCNAAGVVSCRTINSEREKLIAILTNNFSPCNGRFPGLIILASMLINIYLKIKRLDDKNCFGHNDFLCKSFSMRDNFINNQKRNRKHKIYVFGFYFSNFNRFFIMLFIKFFCVLKLIRFLIF